MTRHSSHHARVAAAGLAAGLLLMSGVAAGPAAAATTPVVGCTSARAGLAAELSRDITAALAGRRGTIALGLHDRTTGTTCTLRPFAAYDSASVVKVTILSALLWDAERHGRWLTDRETALSRAMITRSDNDAADTLWRQLGPVKIRRFLAAAGMTQTEPGRDGYWGLTQITVTDEQRLLDLLTARNTVLSDPSRTYVLHLMGQVIASQRWGTPYGAPPAVSVHVKNGWLRRAAYGWRVHSIGTFAGGGHDYTITVLTQGNGTMAYGVSTIQDVAEVIHADLAAS
ncbi:hypothetical protein GCM10010129_12890 [Streptomyces fumigatiscleroticus]|nr:hypothetical protein GCM10010129_12890 [Streptomyces fumigatiscleroticus]